MKVAIIGDIHLGVRDDKEIFHRYFERFFSECFFPELEKRGIKHVIQLGDLFDRRKFLNYTTLKRSKEYLFEPLKKAGIHMHVLVGNHDIALRNTLLINSPELILKEYDNITPIREVQELEFGTKSFLMVPWICSDNYEKSIRALNTSSADYCCGHFEISGFQFYRGVVSHEGLEPNAFDRFHTTFSGHYHHRSSKGSINYVGAPCEHTHMDQGDVRGFDILDTETGDLEFVLNPFTMFEKYVYDDTMVDPRSVDISHFAEKFVKIVVQKKNDYYAFDTFIDRVQNIGAHSVTIMDTITEMTAEQMDESVDIEDTQTILQHYIDTAEVDVDRSELKTYVRQLYIEALHTQQ